MFFYNPKKFKEKDTFWNKYWHYFVFTILSCLAIGFSKDSGVMVIFSICNIAFWAYAVVNLSKRFNIIYLMSIYAIYEAFTGIAFGVGLLSYISAVFIVDCTKRWHSIPILRIFKKDKQIRYIILFTSYITIRDCLSTFVSYVGFNAFYMCGQVAMGYAFYYILNTINNKLTSKNNKFGFGAASYRRY